MSVLVRAGAGVRSFLIPAIVLAVAMRNNPAWGAAALLAAAMVALVLPWLRWRAFTYRIGAAEVTIEQGLLQRSRRTIPLERIQDVSIEQGVSGRLLGLARVKIETGGGVADEGLLDGVGLSEARRLRGLLQGVAVAPADDHAAEDTPLFAMGFGRVLLLGLFNFSLLWLAALFGIVQKFDDLLGFDWPALADIAEHEGAALWSFQLGAALLGVVLVLALVSGLVRAIVRYSGFRLTHKDGRFRAQRGLFARSDTIILDRRIQLALVRSGAVRRWLGWQSLQFQTLGGSEGPSGLLEAAPLARGDEIAPILAAAGLPHFAQQGLIGVGGRHGVATAVRRALPIAIGFGVAGVFAPWAWLGLTLLVPVVAVSLPAARRHRYALRDQELQVRRGVLTQRAWLLPYRSVQVVRLRQGPLQRLLGVATVLPDTAGAGSGPRADLIDVPTGAAMDLTERLAAKAVGFSDSPQASVSGSAWVLPA